MLESILEFFGRTEVQRAVTAISAIVSIAVIGWKVWYSHRHGKLLKKLRPDQREYYIQKAKEVEEKLPVSVPKGFSIGLMGLPSAGKTSVKEMLVLYGVYKRWFVDLTDPDLHKKTEKTASSIENPAITDKTENIDHYLLGVPKESRLTLANSSFRWLCTGRYRITFRDPPGEFYQGVERGNYSAGLSNVLDGASVYLAILDLSKNLPIQCEILERLIKKYDHPPLLVLLTHVDLCNLKNPEISAKRHLARIFTGYKEEPKVIRTNPKNWLEKYYNGVEEKELEEISKLHNVEDIWEELLTLITKKHGLNDEIKRY